MAQRTCVNRSEFFSKEKLNNYTLYIVLFARQCWGSFTEKYISKVCSLYHFGEISVFDLNLQWNLSCCIGITQRNLVYLSVFSCLVNSVYIPVCFGLFADVQRHTGFVQRNLVYPLCMLVLFAVSAVTVLIVIQNTLELLIGIKALPLSTRVTVHLCTSQEIKIVQMSHQTRSTRCG